MTLHVERIGRGAPLVLLHGWGFDSGVWGKLRTTLAARHGLHLVDLPGHGGSCATPFLELDAVVDVVAACIPDASLVCGWSMGGLIAQRLAVKHPAKMRALALVGSTPCFVARAGWRSAIDPGTLDGFAAGLRADTLATLENFVRLNALGGTSTRSTIRALVARLKVSPLPSPSALEQGLRLLRVSDLRAQAATLHVPAVVIHGTRDRIAPVEAGRWLARKLPGAKLFELEDAGHLPFLTHPEAVEGALEQLDA